MARLLQTTVVAALALLQAVSATTPTMQRVAPTAQRSRGSDQLWRGRAQGLPAYGGGDVQPPDGSSYPYGHSLRLGRRSGFEEAIEKAQALARLSKTIADSHITSMRQAHTEIQHLLNTPHPSEADQARAKRLSALAAHHAQRADEAMAQYRKALRSEELHAGARAAAAAAASEAGTQAEDLGFGTLTREERGGSSSSSPARPRKPYRPPGGASSSGRER